MALRNIDIKELKSILAAHKEWLKSGYTRGARANFSGANLSGANLHGDLRALLAVPDLDKKVLEAVKNGHKLKMARWHCGTTHCRAGWAITLAGEKGQLLEALLGSSSAAASLIYAASRPDQRVPDFFASNEAAMASIKADAVVAV